jgi:hypothetical protein
LQQPRYELFNQLKKLLQKMLQQLVLLRHDMLITMSSKAPTKETATKKADTIRPDKNDVLLGKADTVFQHPGNRRFRDLVAMNLKRYEDAKTSDKMVLVRQGTEQVIDNGTVRFPLR